VSTRGTNDILIITVPHKSIRSVHGDLIDGAEPKYEQLKYNPTIMFWDIETTTPENDNKTSEIQKTSIPYMISVIYKDRQDTIRKYIICTK
jgi:hypothetical protein